jgi:hypothetical protein
MGRYTTQVVSFNDATPSGAYSSVRSCTLAPGAYIGTCVFQMTGGSNGYQSTGNLGSGYCCAFTVPTGVTQMFIEIWGGGGGGGGGAWCWCCGFGTGGGGGAYAKKYLSSVSAGSSYTICVGAGGQGGIPGSSSACCCGQKGVTTYVTGPGLTNFCAEGGYGGESRCAETCRSGVTPNGGFPGTGGDLNLRGYDGGRLIGNDAGQPWCHGWGWGGGSPFGGRNMHIGYDFCSQYVDERGTGKFGGICGFTGMFPGGGGTPGWPSCCCGICSCGGDGATGMVRIWM